MFFCSLGYLLLLYKLINTINLHAGIPHCARWIKQTPLDWNAGPILVSSTPDVDESDDIVVIGFLGSAGSTSSPSFCPCQRLSTGEGGIRSARVKGTYTVLHRGDVVLRHPHHLHHVGHLHRHPVASRRRSKTHRNPSVKNALDSRRWSKRTGIARRSSAE